MSNYTAFVYLCVINSTTWVASEHPRGDVWASLWIVLACIGMLVQVLPLKKR